jgi:hypothetical protein
MANHDARKQKRPGGNRGATSAHQTGHKYSAAELRDLGEGLMRILFECSLEEGRQPLASAAFEAFRVLRASWSTQEVEAMERAKGLRR